MNDEQKRIKALIDEQIRLLKDNPKLKGKTEGQLWTAELRSRVMKANHANPEYRAKWDEKQKLGAQKRFADPKWQKNHKLSTQKANSKKISCDGVIYESQKTAALALAPETRLTEKSKSKWFENQMKKFPERYFYIDTDSI